MAGLLLRGRNADGGWGYFAGKASRLEPTCWALLALADRPGASVDAAPLRAWPARDGLLLERRDGDPNFAFHGLALLTLLALQADHAAGNAALADAMQRARSATFENSPYFRQDNSLVGWSWVAGTFGWVEPTAWCLLALKKWARVPGAGADAARIAEAERLLGDRACRGGGWNYGNANVLGQDLHPYVPTTAVALLALQNRREQPATTAGVAWLDAEGTTERSASSLALAALALRVYGRDAAALRAALVDQLPVTMGLGNHAAAAMALYALRTDHRDAAVTL